MLLVIHSDQGREFENGLMKSLCTLFGYVKTRTAPYHPESDGMVERFNRTCLMMLSMFVNDRRDNWSELLPFVMHAYRTSIYESTGYSPFRLMMGEECPLPQDVSTDELRTNREHNVAPHPFVAWVRDALEVAYDHVRHSLHRMAARRKRLYSVKAVNCKFPVGSWVLRYYPPPPPPPGGSEEIRIPVGQTPTSRPPSHRSYGGHSERTGHPDCFYSCGWFEDMSSPRDVVWTPEPSTVKSLCASTVAFRPGSHISDSISTPSMDVSTGLILIVHKLPIVGRPTTIKWYFHHILYFYIFTGDFRFLFQNYFTYIFYISLYSESSGRLSVLYICFIGVTASWPSSDLGGGVWRSHVGLAWQGWTGGPQYKLLCIWARTPLVAVCLVIACVRMAGNWWVRVVRWDRMLSLEKVCRGMDVIYNVVLCAGAAGRYIYFYNKWPEIGLYKLNYWTLPCVIHHPSHHTCITHPNISDEFDNWPGLYAKVVILTNYG